MEYRVARPRLNEYVRAQLRERQALITEHFSRGGMRGSAEFLDLDAIRREVLSIFEEAHSYSWSEPLWRCAYTGVRLDSPRVTHHRPPFDSQVDSGEVLPQHYHWLLTDPRNVFLCQPSVIDRKGHYFPVLGSPSPPPEGRKQPRRDVGLLLEPGRDYPGWWLRAEPDGSYVARAHPNRRTDRRRGPRGEVTIDRLGLNDPYLVEERRRESEHLDVDRLVEIELALASSHARQLVARQLLRRPDVLEEYGAVAPGLLSRLDAELAGEYAVEAIESDPPDLAPPVVALILRTLNRLSPGSEIRDFVLNRLAHAGGRTYAPGQIRRQERRVRRSAPKAALRIHRGASLSRIDVSNFKSIRSTSLQLPSNGKDETATSVALLGENGVGKTAILEAICIGLAGMDAQAMLQQAEVDVTDLVRDGAATAEVRLTFDTSQEIAVAIERSGDVHVSPASFDSDLLAVGFSAVRSQRGRRSDATASADPIPRQMLDHVFDPRHHLGPSIDSLRALDREGRRLAEKTLTRFLDTSTESASTVRITDDGVHVGGRPVRQLSDGFRSVVGLLATVMAADGLGRATTQSIAGIAVIDELGAHLHPRWRMRIVGLLREVFPRLQLLVSTHEPLCLRGFVEGEVHLVTTSEGASRFEAIPRSPSDLRVDQLLSSEFFGLHSTIDPEEEVRLAQYYAARQRLHRAGPELDPDERQALEQEVARLRPAPTHGRLGSTRREQLMFEVIDEHIAIDSELTGDELRHSRDIALSRAAAIWRGHPTTDEAP